MERILESRKAFALGRYQKESGFNKKGLERDTANLVIEASGNIHSFFLAILPDGRVINPSIDKVTDVSEFYAEDSPQVRKEKVAGLKIKDALINEPEETLVAWISPPGGEFKYKEARFEIGRVRKLLGIKILQSYGIPLKGVTPEYCEKLFLMLEEFSSKPDQIINNPEELRDKISIFKSQGPNWISFLTEVFPELTPIFKRVQEGEVHRLKMKAINDARHVVTEKLEKKDVSKENLIRMGAKIERGMEERGWNLSGERCGYLNSDLLEMQNKGFFGMIKIKNEEGMGEIKKGEKWDYHKDKCVDPECPYKGKKVWVGPCGICEDCEKKYKTTNN